MSAGRKVLVVDDNDRLRERLVLAFEDRGLEARGAGDYDAALSVIADWTPTDAVVDLRMPGPSGLELVPVLIAQLPQLRVVVLTGYGSIATAVEAVRRGALNYLSKPADPDEILAALERSAEPLTQAQTPSLARAEWEHINRVLEDCDGNISQAAKRLGLHRRTLQRKLSKYPPRK